MFDWLKRLISSHKSVHDPIAVRHIQSIMPSDFKNPELQYDDRVAKALLFFVGKQILLMGYRLEEVPLDEKYLSKGCRGYLIGVSHGVITCIGQPIEKSYHDHLVRSAFMMVYGRQAGLKIAEQTMQEFVPGSGLARGYVNGTHEVEAVFQTDHLEMTSGVGFDLLASIGE